MKAPNKMMIAVGALALTATTLLAGCGGSSNDSADSAPAEAPTSIYEGTVKPADVTDDDWATAVTAGDDNFFQNMENATPEQLAKVCAEGATIDTAANVQTSLALGGTAEEWTQVWEKVISNMVLVSCSMAE